MITIPIWLPPVIVAGMWLLSAASNAMSMTDRSLYGWVFRFGRIVTASAPSFLEREFHIPLPTQADPSQGTSAQK